MLKQRMIAAEKIAAELHDAENAVDHAIIKLAKLAGTLPVARFDTNMSAIVGQDAVAKVTQAVAAAGQVRQMVADAHQALSETQRQVGLGARMFGAGTEKPKGNAIIADRTAANESSRPVTAVA
jgi:dGTP triphosphohydrolase